MSTTYPGHAEWIVARKKKTSTGKIPRNCNCLPCYYIKQQNKYMGWGGGGRRWISQINTSLTTTYRGELYGSEELYVIGKCHLSYHQCRYCKCFYSLQLSGLSGRVECYQWTCVGKTFLRFNMLNWNTPNEKPTKYFVSIAWHACSLELQWACRTKNAAWLHLRLPEFGCKFFTISIYAGTYTYYRLKGRNAGYARQFRVGRSVTIFSRLWKRQQRREPCKHFISLAESMGVCIRIISKLHLIETFSNGV